MRADERERHAGERVAWELVFVEVVSALRRDRLRMAAMALREDAAEIRVPDVILDEHRDRRRLVWDIWDREAFHLERQLTARDDSNAVLLCLFVGADDAVEAIS